MNILTFDIGVTNIRYALCDEQFRLSDVHTVPTRAQQGGQHRLVMIQGIIGRNAEDIVISKRMEIAANRPGGDQGGQGDQHKQDRQRPQPEGNDGWRQTVAERWIVRGCQDIPPFREAG